MRSEHLVRFVVVNGLALALGAVVATSCIKVNYPTVAFRCNPRQPDNCPDTHFCCSDDPSTADGELPSFVGKGITGSVPLYADDANRVGVSGMCVNQGEIPAGFGLLSAAAPNCPIPCNPKWGGGDVEDVCGAGRVCCQTVEVQDKDCVLEDGGGWRPVSGSDIGSSAISPTTNWNAVAHATHQDPNGTVCLALNGNDNQSAGFQECIRHLTVADQRGFCMGLALGQSCPTAADTYQSICDIKNGTPPP